MIRLNPVDQNIAQPIIENQMNWGNSLPADLFGVIFSHLKLIDMQQSSCANKYWNAQAVNSVIGFKISSLNSQILKMNNPVKEQLVNDLNNSTIAQSKNLKAVISTTFEMRKKILIAVQNLNNSVQIKTYLENLLNEAMDHGRLDQAIDAVDLINSDNIQREAFNIRREAFHKVGDILCNKSSSVLIKLLLKLNEFQKIQFAKYLNNFSFKTYLQPKIVACTDYIGSATLKDFENLIAVLKLSPENPSRIHALEKIIKKMKDQGFFEAGYKIECDQFEKNVLPKLLNFLSSIGQFELAKALIKEISFLDNIKYQKQINPYLLNDKLATSSNYLEYYSRKLAKIGYDELSLQFADIITDTQLKEKRLRDISIELLVKDLNKAAKIAALVPAHLYCYQGIDALRQLTSSLIFNGFHEKAYEIINAIPDDRIIMGESCKELLIANLKSLNLK